MLTSIRNAEAVNKYSIGIIKPYFLVGSPELLLLV